MLYNCCWTRKFSCVCNRCYYVMWIPNYHFTKYHSLNIGEKLWPKSKHPDLPWDLAKYLPRISVVLQLLTVRQCEAYKRNAKVQKKGQPSICHSTIVVFRLWEINDSEGDQGWIKNKSSQFLSRSAPVKIWKLWWEITSLYVTLLKDKWNHTFLEQCLIKIHAEIYKYFNGW